MHGRGRAFRAAFTEGIPLSECRCRLFRSVAADVPVAPEGPFDENVPVAVGGVWVFPSAADGSRVCRRVGEDMSIAVEDV